MMIAMVMLMIMMLMMSVMLIVMMISFQYCDHDYEYFGGGDEKEGKDGMVFLVVDREGELLFFSASSASASTHPPTPPFLSQSLPTQLNTMQVLITCTLDLVMREEKQPKALLLVASLPSRRGPAEMKEDSIELPC